ncbi:MAG: ABC transporter permease [Fibrobacter sp.]|nr:ABC transporter permease [Fibrobacter sp.]
MSEMNSEKWTTEIKPKSSLLSVDFKELWQYRDLYRMFVKRDIVTWYKQTILGPLWFFIQPIMTTIMFMVVFGGIAKISTDGLPQPLFYLAGICLWQYFAESLSQTSKTFIDNANVFGKVYFPRLVVPMATVTSNLVRLAIQMGLFLIVSAYYMIFTSAPVHPNIYALLTPVLILILAGLALGFGILFSSLTTKYRDLTFLLSFIVQLWMYATPVIYPMSTITDPRLKMLMQANPLSSIMETFKFGMLGVGEFSWCALGYSAAFAAILLALGIIVFNRIQKTFMDTV